VSNTTGELQAESGGSKIGEEHPVNYRAQKTSTLLLNKEEILT
jgi:hypothetical protein